MDTCKGCLAVRRLLAASCMVVGTVPGAAGGWSESKPLEIFLGGEREVAEFFLVRQEFFVWLLLGRERDHRERDHRERGDHRETGVS